MRVIFIVVVRQQGCRSADEEGVILFESASALGWGRSSRVKARRPRFVRRCRHRVEICARQRCDVIKAKVEMSLRCVRLKKSRGKVER